jgi:hypothetical protein
MSDFDFEDDPCHASWLIGDGCLWVLSVCIMVNDGWSAATSIDPLAYPMAKVLQSIDGASDVMGSYIVFLDMCSLVVGSNNIMFP